METKNMIGGIVSLAVVVICVALIMMPVLSDATKTTETLTNEGVYYIVDDDDVSHTLEFDGTDVTVDGDVLDIPTGKEYTLYADESCVIRINSAQTAIQIRGANTLNLLACDFTIASGTLSGSYTDANSDTGTFSNSYTEYILATNDQEEMLLKDYTGTANLLGDSEIIGRGLTALNANTTNYRYIQLEGTIDDGITVTIYDTEGTWTVDNIVVNAVENSDYVDTYTFTSITFDVTHVSTEAVTHCTYSSVIVPSEITAEMSKHLGAGEIALINAIPVLVIVSIVIAAVGLAITSRRD